MSTSWEWQGLVQSRVIGESKRKALMNLLAAAADEDGRSFWSYGRLGAALEVSTKTIGTMLTQLEGRGLLSRARRRRGNGQLSVYDVRLCWNAIHALPLTGWQPRRVEMIPEPASGSQGSPGPSPAEARVPLASGSQGSSGPAEAQGFRAEPQGVNPKGEHQPSSPPAAGEQAPARRRAAHALAVLAFEQPVKPTISGDDSKRFVAVLGLFDRALSAGRSVQQIERAIVAGIDVWTTQGLNTALAKGRNGKVRDGSLGGLGHLRFDDAGNLIK